MKRTRIGIKRRQRKINIGIAIFFLVILPVTAVVIGSRITEWWIIPTINTDYILNSPENINLEEIQEQESNQTEPVSNLVEETKKVEVDKEETVDLNSMSAYMIQVASVSDNGNIETLVEELNSYNFPSIVYKIDNSYKIYSYGATEREHIESKLDKIREVYPDAYIGQMHIPKKQIVYSKEKNSGASEVIDNMNLVIEILNKSSDTLYKDMNNQENIKAYKEVLNSHQRLLEDMSEKIANVEFPVQLFSAEDIKKMIEHQQKNISESLKIIEDDQEKHKLEEHFLDTLFRTIEVVKKN